MLHDKLKVIGSLSIILSGEDGVIKQTIDIPNLVVTTGLNNIRERFVLGTSAAMSHMAVGTNATVPALAQTTLGAEVARVALTSTGGAGSSIIYIASFPAGVGTGLLTEAGMFNATPAGTMLSRSLFSSPIDKGASDTLTITWTITLG